MLVILARRYTSARVFSAYTQLALWKCLLFYIFIVKLYKAMTNPSVAHHYHELLAGSSEELEHMGHDPRFEQVLNDNAIERSTLYTATPEKAVVLERDRLPNEMTNLIYLPGRVRVDNLQARLSEVPPSLSIPEFTWSLTTTFVIMDASNAEKAPMAMTLITTDAYTSISSSNSMGDPFTIIADTRLGGELLLAIFGNTLEQGADEFLERASTQDLSDTKNLSNLLVLLGKTSGNTDKTTTAHLPHPKAKGRALVVAMTESEGTYTNGQKILYHLAAEIGEKYTAMKSSQQETIDSSEVALQSLVERSGKRHPTDIPMDDFVLAVQMGMYDDPRGKLLNPEATREQYDLVSVAMMTILRPYLESAKPVLTTLDRSDGPDVLFETIEDDFARPDDE